MKFDHDCAREVLLAIESATFDERITLDWLCGKLPKYSEESIWYVCLKLDEAELLVVDTIDIRGSCMPGIKVIRYMTYGGHEFLDKVRDDERWNKLNGALKAVRNYSLDAIGAVSQGMTSAAISALLESKFG